MNKDITYGFTYKKHDLYDPVNGTCPLTTPGAQSTVTQGFTSKDRKD